MAVLSAWVAAAHCSSVQRVDITLSRPGRVARLCHSCKVSGSMGVFYTLTSADDWAAWRLGKKTS